MLLGDFNTIYYNFADSTQSRAKDLLDTGYKPPLIVIARHQENGVGRHGREWLSVDGDITITIVISPMDTYSNWPKFSYIAALSVGEVVIDSDISYKWPNDVMIDGKKLSGILLERHKNNLLIGIGVNFIKKEIDGTISLSEIGFYDIDLVISNITQNFQTLYNNYMLNGFSYIREKWMSKAKIGLEVNSVFANGNVVKGNFGGIDEDGRLMLINDDTVIKVYAADIFFIKR